VFPAVVVLIDFDVIDAARRDLCGAAGLAELTGSRK